MQRRRKTSRRLAFGSEGRRDGEGRGMDGSRPRVSAIFRLTEIPPCRPVSASCSTLMMSPSQRAPRQTAEDEQAGPDPSPPIYRPEIKRIVHRPGSAWQRAGASREEKNSKNAKSAEAVNWHTSHPALHRTTNKRPPRDPPSPIAPHHKIPVPAVAPSPSSCCANSEIKGEGENRRLAPCWPHHPRAQEDLNLFTC